MKPLRCLIAPLAILAGFALGGCSTSEPEPDGVEKVGMDGLQDEIRFTYDAADPFTFTVNANRTWSVTRDAALDWFTIDPMSGRTGRTATVTVKASLNDDLERRGSFVFSCGSVNRTVTVIQDAFPIVPELKVNLEERVVPFKFNVLDPVQFTVWSNVAWKVEKTGLDWLEVTPMQGERKTEVTVTLTPSINEGAAREGTLTFKAEGAQDVEVRVTQTEFVDDPIFTLDGLPEGNSIEFDRKPGEPLVLTIVTNRNWSAIKSEGLDWLSVTPDSGVKNLDGVSVQVSASVNGSAMPRNGTVTFRSADSANQDIVLTVSQRGLTSEWKWTLEDGYLQENRKQTWVDQNKSLSDDGSALMEWVIANEDSKYSDLTKRTAIISSDKAGHYAFKEIWGNDNLQFTVPVEDLPANSKVTLQIAMSGTKYAPAFWTVEYFEDGEWHATSIKPGLKTKKGMPADNTFDEATFVLPDADKVVNIKETAVFKNAVEKGELKLRIRCAEGKYTVNFNNQSKAHASGTVRFRQWSDGTCNEIRIKIEK